MLKALDDFRVTFTDELDIKHLLEFREGDLIPDPRIGRYLLSLACPVVVVSNQTSVTCPRCHFMFDRTQHPIESTIVLVNGLVQHDGFTFPYEAGQIVEHSWLIESLKAAGVPLDTITATKCPNQKCGHVFH